MLNEHHFKTMYSYFKTKTPICMCSIIHAVHTTKEFIAYHWSLCTKNINLNNTKTQQIIKARVHSARGLSLIKKSRCEALWIYFRLIIRGSRFMLPKWRAGYELFKHSERLFDYQALNKYRYFSKFVYGNGTFGCLLQNYEFEFSWTNIGWATENQD